MSYKSFNGKYQMKRLFLITIALFILFASYLCEGKDEIAVNTKSGVVKAHSRGLHGYISYSANRPPDHSIYSSGMGFYSAVWPLIDKPIAHFQIGLAGAMRSNSCRNDFSCGRMICAGALTTSAMVLSQSLKASDCPKRWSCQGRYGRH
jgi:hypothetical protein